MAKNKKQFKDYQDYLASPEWKALKDEFYNKYEGFNNVCQISGRTIDKSNDNGDYMCLHHWQYPSDWSNDSIENIILVCNDTHNWIHDNGWTLKESLDKETITSCEKCKCELIALYIESDPHGFGSEGYQHGRESMSDNVELVQQRNDLIENHSKLLKFIDRRDNHIDYLIKDIDRLNKELSNGKKQND